MKTPASFRARNGWRRALGVLAVSTLALTGTLATVAMTTSTASASTTSELVRTVTYNGRTVTVRLHPITLRGSKFEVLVQQADGSMVRQTNVHQASGWLGSVDGDSAATAGGIIRSDGLFDGSVNFDRGATWRFRDTDATGTATTVYTTRGLTQPTAFKWPSATDASRNVSTSPGQAGTTTYGWDLGFDLSNIWFTNAAIGSSIDKALDAVDLSVATLNDLYIPDALVRPYVARVIIRADAAKDPYAGSGSHLGVVTDEWKTNQVDSGVDDVALFNGSNSSGGVAWVGSAGTTQGAASNGGNGIPMSILRHELGHTWGPHDNHTNGPEGATIQSGNQFDRFDGTELSAILRYKNGRLSKFTPEGLFAEPLPPYAALDLNDNQVSGVPFSFKPTGNDHDANNDALTLASVESTSALGGTVSQNGDMVTYTPPAVTTDKAVDWFKYVVRDASGKTATGVSMFRVTMPPVAPQTEGRAAGWAVHAITNGGTYTALGNGSSLFAAAPLDGTVGLVQRSGTDTGASWRFNRVGEGYTLTNPNTGQCAQPRAGSIEDKATMVQAACSSTLPEQQFKALDAPNGGTALLNVKSGKCVIVQGASLAEGAALVQYPCGQFTNRLWTLTAKS